MAAMDAGELKEIQAPLKARYRDDATAALVTLRADGEACTIDVPSESECGFVQRQSRAGAIGDGSCQP